MVPSVLCLRTATYDDEPPPPPLAVQDSVERTVTTATPLLDGSAPLRAIKNMVMAIADTDATVLLRGESGVGKEVIARAIHEASTRSSHSFIKVNCAALPAELLESELFGHEKGAFTGAHRRKLGRFEYATHGTLYLDEIGELPVALQPKLLHVLQDFEFFRVGGHEPLSADVRIIAATNRNLELAMQQGQFREDLFYRLNVVDIHIPPLRERREEIPLLAARFLEVFKQQYHRDADLTPQAMATFMEYSWPGNIRELENVVRRFVLLGERPVLDALLSAPSEPVVNHDVPLAQNGFEALRDVARRGAQEAERKALTAVLDQVGWNRVAAARALKVSYKTLLNKIAECELTPPDTRKSK
jgi:two-component system, NtrC family, response regulator AtoC